MIEKEKKRRKYFKALQTNQVLKGLEPFELDALLDQLQEEKLPGNTCWLNQMQVTTRFHFVISGRLKIYKLDEQTGREFTLFLLRKNDAFDVLCLLDGCKHDVFYESLDPVVLLHIPMSIMKRWLSEHPGIRNNILPYLSQNMRSLEEYAANITLLDIPTRLAKLILKNINVDSRELELINDLSNDEIAKLIGSTRAVVNRHFQIFKQEGILSIGRQKVRILDLEGLLKKARSAGGAAGRF